VSLVTDGSGEVRTELFDDVSVRRRAAFTGDTELVELTARNWLRDHRVHV